MISIKGALPLRLSRLLLLILLWAPLAGAHAQFDHHHQAWAALLKKHVVLLDGGKEIIREQKAEIRHLDYDWNLNDARK